MKELTKKFVLFRRANGFHVINEVTMLGSEIISGVDNFSQVFLSGSDEPLETVSKANKIINACAKPALDFEAEKEKADRLYWLVQNVEKFMCIENNKFISTQYKTDRKIVRTMAKSILYCIAFLNEHNGYTDEYTMWSTETQRIEIKTLKAGDLFMLFRVWEQVPWERKNGWADKKPTLYLKSEFGENNSFLYAPST